MIIKQTIGNGFHLGGPLSEIEPISFSCYNFNNNFNSELIEMSPDFHYFTVKAEDYVYARAKNMLINWAYSDSTGTLAQRLGRTRMAKKLSVIKAKRELQDYREESFIHNNQNYSARTYDFGAIPMDLNELSDESGDKEKQISFDDLEEKKETIIEVIVN